MSGQVFLVAEVRFTVRQLAAKSVSLIKSFFAPGVPCAGTLAVGRPAAMRHPTLVALLVAPPLAPWQRQPCVLRRREAALQPEQLPLPPPPPLPVQSLDFPRSCPTDAPSLVDPTWLHFITVRLLVPNSRPSCHPVAAEQAPCLPEQQQPPWSRSRCTAKTMPPPWRCTRQVMHQPAASRHGSNLSQCGA